MIRRNLPIAWTLLLLGVLTLSAAQAADLDTVTVRAAAGSEESTELEGVIKADNYKEVVIAVGGGAEVSKARDLVVEFNYAQANMGEFNAGVEAYDAGSYEAALKHFETAAASVGRMSRREQQPLFGQHCLFYRGMCQFQLGQYEEAHKSLFTLNSRVENSAYKFEAGFYEARALEETNRSEAKTKYTLRVREYAEIYKRQKIEAARRWEVLSSLAILRLGLEDAIASERATEIESSLSQLRGLKSNEAVWGLLSQADRAKVILLEASALKALKRYGDLVPVLNVAIRNAQRDNDRDAMKGFYLQRADANWQLFEKTGEGKERSGYAEAVQIDALRLDLLFPLSADEAATANYRLGKTFVELKGPDWKERALFHLEKAKAVQAGNASTRAAGFLEEVKKMKGPAASNKKGG